MATDGVVLKDEVIYDIVEVFPLGKVHRLGAKLEVSNVEIEKKEMKLNNSMNRVIEELLFDWKVRKGDRIRQARKLHEIMTALNVDKAVAIIQKAIDQQVPPQVPPQVQPQVQPQVPPQVQPPPYQEIEPAMMELDMPDMR